jgi:hypothetical protein
LFVFELVLRFSTMCDKNKKKKNSYWIIANKAKWEFFTYFYCFKIFFKGTQLTVKMDGQETLFGVIKSSKVFCQKIYFSLNRLKFSLELFYYNSYIENRFLCGEGGLIASQMQHIICLSKIQRRRMLAKINSSVQ